jgi:hypothetical protein
VSCADAWRRGARAGKARGLPPLSPPEGGGEIKLNKYVTEKLRAHTAKSKENPRKNRSCEKNIAKRLVFLKKNQKNGLTYSEKRGIFVTH